MNYSMNLSEYEYDYPVNGVCEKDEVNEFGSIAIPLFFSVVITLSLTGNILVLIILIRYENLKSLTNIFIFNLAISDLVFTAGLPFWAIDHIWGWLFSENICKIVTFVFFTGFYSSVLFLTTMTIYRYLAVVHPLSDARTQTFRTGLLMSLLMWLISSGAALPSLLFSSVVTIYHKQEHSLGCEYGDALWNKVGIIQQNVFFLAAFGVMGFCYIRILQRITRSRSHTKNRAIKLAFSIVAVFFVGWVPYNVVIFLSVLDHSMVESPFSCEASIQLDYVVYVCRLIAFSHCCLNPVFYAFVGVKFRGHLKAILHRMLGRPTAASEPQVRMQNLVSQGSLY